MGPWSQWRGGPGRDAERQMRQLREIARLGAVLRAEVGVEQVANELVTAVTAAFGFRVAALNIVRLGSDHMHVLAASGLSEVDRQRLLKEPPSIDRMLAVMHDQFLVSRSYFISHNYRYLLEGAGGVTVFTPQSPEQQRSPDAWHPEDVLLVPFYGRQQQGLLGLLSLDMPADGKIPTPEALEPVELLTEVAAAALETALIFEARERDRAALERSVAELNLQLAQAQAGRLDTRIRATEPGLIELVETLNALLTRLRDVLIEVRDTGALMSHTTDDMRVGALSLATIAQQQAERILEVSRSVQGMSQGVQRITETAAHAGLVAREAIGISENGREAAERAAAGMTAVREMVLQSAKRIKRLGESMQEIGAIVEMVQDFANQTNLLALNATIEAARAGQHGRGFSVVANEIRSLAISSTDAVKQVHARIKGIQSDTAQVVVTIEHSTEQVVVQSELAARAGAALQDVDVVTQRIAGSIQVMNETATQQTHATAHISGVMTDIANSTAQTWDGVERLRSSIDKLGEMTVAILRGLDGFQLSTVGQPYITAPPLPEIVESATQPLPVMKAGDPPHPLVAAEPANPPDSAPAPADAAPELADVAVAPDSSAWPDASSAPDAVEAPVIGELAEREPESSADREPVPIVAGAMEPSMAEETEADIPVVAADQGKLADISTRPTAPPAFEPEGE
jgi:methyl-accepting chemotaxis protein